MSWRRKEGFRMPIRDFIVSELDKLNSLYEMYEDLNKKSNHKYNYRVKCYWLYDYVRQRDRFK